MKATKKYFLYFAVFVVPFLLITFLFIFLPNLVHATDGVNVSVRIETPNRSIWQGLVQVDGCSIKDSEGKEHLLTGPKAACALDATAKQGNFSYTFEDSPWGLFLTAIEGQPPPADFDNFWLYFVNYAPGDVGLAEKDLSEGDELLLFLSSWPPPSLLKVSVSKTTVEVNEPFTILSTYYDETKADFVSLGSVSVHLGDQTFQTGENGILALSLAEPGLYPLSLEKEGYLRSEKLPIKVLEPITPPPPQNPPVTPEQLKEAVQKALTHLSGQQASEGVIENAGVSAWATLAFGAAGRYSDTVKKGEASLWDFLKTYKPSKATDFGRQILAVVASGKDPHNFGGLDLVAQLKGFYNNGQIGDPNFINDDIFGVLALLTANEEPNQEIILNSIKYIIDHQQADGGFSYSAQNIGGDVDDTAAAIQVLTAAQNKSLNLNLSFTLDSAKAFLRSSQNDDGGFPYMKGGTDGDSNSASTSWAIQALIALGENPLQWGKEGGLTPYHFLLSLQREDGSFSWSPGGESSNLMTAYAVPALLQKNWPIVLPRTPDSSTGVVSSPALSPGVEKSKEEPKTEKDLKRAAKSDERGEVKKGFAKSEQETATKSAQGNAQVLENNLQNKGGENKEVEKKDQGKRVKKETSNTGQKRFNFPLPVSEEDKKFILLVFIASLVAAGGLTFSMVARVIKVKP